MSANERKRGDWKRQLQDAPADPIAVSSTNKSCGDKKKKGKFGPVVTSSSLYVVLTERTTGANSTKAQRGVHSGCWLFECGRGADRSRRESHTHRWNKIHKKRKEKKELATRILKLQSKRRERGKYKKEGEQQSVLLVADLQVEEITTTERWRKERERDERQSRKKKKKKREAILVSVYIPRRLTGPAQGGAKCLAAQLSWNAPDDGSGGSNGEEDWRGERRRGEGYSSSWIWLLLGVVLLYLASPLTSSRGPCCLMIWESQLLHSSPIEREGQGRIHGRPGQQEEEEDALWYSLSCHTFASSRHQIDIDPIPPPIIFSSGPGVLIRFHSLWLLSFIQPFLPSLCSTWPAISAVFISGLTKSPRLNSTADWIPARMTILLFCFTEKIRGGPLALRCASTDGPIIIAHRLISKEKLDPVYQIQSS